MVSLILTTALALLVYRVAAEGGQSGGSSASAGPSQADLDNVKIEKYLGWTWAALVGTILIYRIILLSIRYIRTIASIGHDKQRIFMMPDLKYAAFKRYILDAPLFRKRHHREFMLSSAVNVGTLPSRLQTFVIMAYLGMNVAFSVIYIDWSGKRSVVAGQLRNRTGTLSVMNMIPLFLMAGRNNPLITILDISYDTYNLLHRWIGRIVVLEALAHTLAWMVNEVMTAGWKTVAMAMGKSQLIMTGTIGTCALLAILFLSPSILRHAYYEVFLGVHFLLALTTCVVVWMHLETLPQQSLMLAAIAVWIAERLMRVYLIVRNNAAAGGTKAEIEALPGDAIRVTLRIGRPWKFLPGQHVFLYIPSVGWWTSHPFSLAWSEEEQDLYSEKGLPMDRQDILSMQKTTMSLIIRRRTGFTEKLWQKVERSESGRFTTSAIVEGPYGHQNLDSYGTVMLFAAGVGITHQVPFVRALVAAYANGTSATRRVTLVWIIQSPEHLEWIRPWMTNILGMDKRRDVLKILLFVTRPRSTKEIHSPSSSVQMFPGKPDVNALIQQEQAKQIGAMAVSVCGTGSLSDDVRRAVRVRCEKSTIDFVENAFSW